MKVSRGFDGKAENRGIESKGSLRKEFQVLRIAHGLTPQ